MNPTITTYNNVKCLHLENGQIARPLPNVEGQSLSDRRRFIEAAFTVFGYLPYFSSVPSIEFYMGLVSGTTNWPLDSDNTTHFLGLYKAPTSGWEISSVDKIYYVISGHADGIKGVRRVGTTNTFLTTHNDSSVIFPTVQSASSKQLCVFGLYVSRTSTEWRLRPFRIYSFSNWSVASSWEEDAVIYSSAGSPYRSAYGPASSFSTDSLVEDTYGYFTHFYFGWRTTSSPTIPFYLTKVTCHFIRHSS